MKNDIDDLLNSVFGSRTLRTGGQAAGREKPETPRLTLEPEPKQPSPRGRSPQRRTRQAACTLRIEWEIQIGYTTLITG